MYQYIENEILQTSAENNAGFAENKNRLQKWFTQHAGLNNTQPFYKVMSSTLEKDLEQYYKISDEIRNDCDDVVIIAMGGASLIAQFICSMSNASSPKMHFLSGTDSAQFDILFQKINISSTKFIVISNSGETIETVFLTRSAIEKCQEGTIDISDNFYFLTNPRDSALSQIATKINATLLAHEVNISGRFSIFTSLALMMGSVAGVDIYQFFAGAQEIYKNFWKFQEQSVPAKAALNVAVLNKNIAVQVTYTQKLLPLLHWHSQNIAESLAKNGKGWTPITSLAPQDQHGLFQLYLAGPNDKLYSLFTVEQMQKTELSSLHYKMQNITLDALENAHRPVRQFILSSNSSMSLGAVTAHLLLETILIGELHGVNPFNQPEIDKLKQDILAAS